jgi:hypothetical protein
VICYSDKKEVMYVDLDEVRASVRSKSNQTNISLVLKDYVRSIKLGPIQPKKGYVHPLSSFQKSHWTLVWAGSHNDSFVGFVCKLKANLNDRRRYAKIELKLTDLYKTDWSYQSHLLKVNLLYLSLKEFQGSSRLSICLALFRLDEQANTFTKVCSERFIFPPELINPTTCNTELLCANCRVFSVAFGFGIKNFVWIHCFMRNKIVPIGGSNTRTPGLYSLSPMQSIHLSYYDGNCVGIFGVEKDHRMRGNDLVYKIFRYVLV